MNDASPSLEFDDIQGFVLRGFGKLAHATYAFFRLDSKPKFQAWLAATLAADGITPASHRIATGGCRQSIALTTAGLQKLLVDAWIADTFPAEFVEGMVQEHRSRLLGDIAGNAPEHWRWGHGDGIDGVLIVAAESEAVVSARLAEILVPDHGMAEVLRQSARLPADGREPFGFADGISQPIIAGTDRDKEKRRQNPREHKLHSVAAGEFILGYADGTGRLPRTPAISPAGDAAGLLKPHPERPELRDFGRNGSFLVMRQLAQDVDGFAVFVKAKAEAGIDIGAKMVGRTRDGEALAPDSAATTDNDFDYLEDSAGHGCPIGSHVRRTNPRSTVHASSQEASLKVTNRHRIIRRGRVYGNADGETGLMFLCLNASISRQFEFVQATWSNDPFFQGLAGEVDPIIGTQRPTAQDFTIPRAPYRHKVTSLPQWVTLKGGGYFFLPGLSALKVLANSGIDC